MDILTTLQKAINAFLDQPRCILIVSVTQENYDTADQILRGLPSSYRVYGKKEKGRIVVERKDASKLYDSMMLPLVVDLTEEA